MSPPRRLVCVALACVAATLPPAAPAAAQTPMTSAFAADASATGVISLIFWGARGGTVQYFERVGDDLKPLGRARAAAGAATVLKDATTWSCDRLERRFEAIAKLPDGSVATGEYGVRTASCAQRFTLRAPRRVEPGETVRVRVSDRWGIGGIRPELCITPPEGERRCRTLEFRRAVSVASREFEPSRRGRWRVELRVRKHRTRRSVAVGSGTRIRERTAPTVLATGDSTMQGIDSFLADELGEAATLRSDVRIGSGITRGRYWLDHAVQQVKRYRPRITVMSVGAAIDAFPLPTAAGPNVECCGEAWIDAYAGRVRTIMQIYRTSSERVFWLTPPLPRDPQRLTISAAIITAIVRGAAGLDGVQVVRVDELFSPDGYQEVIRYRGRDVRVRDADGVHLNIPGTAIMAELLAPTILGLLVRKDTSR